jgi:hypothetical protein
MATIEQLQNQLDSKALDPNKLSPKQRKIIDELIKRGDLKGPSLSVLQKQRDSAAKAIAREEEYYKDPIATALAEEDSFFKGRPTAVFAGDITGSIAPYLVMREQIYGAAKSGNLWKKGPGKMAQVAGAMADKLPGRLKLLGGAFKLLGRVADVPAKVLQSPLGRAEIYSILGGTAGAGAGSVTYDMLNEQAGTFIASQISDAFADLPEKEVNSDMTLNALNEMKSALYWNAGASLLTPLIVGPLGKAGKKLFGTTGAKQKELAEYARDKGLPIPLIQAMDGGIFSGIGKTFFKTVGVFPFIGPIANQAFQGAEQKAGKMYLDQLTAYAPLMKTGALSHSIYNQAAKVFNDNMDLIGARYDAFERLADTVGNPAIISLEKTVAKAQELKQSLTGMFPDTGRAMQSKNIDEVLKGSGDPINLFYEAMDAIGTNMITPKQYKGVIQMLNNAIQGTDYKTLGRQMFMIREALENDFNAFGANLTKNAFLKDPGLKATYEGLAKQSPERAEAFIAGNIANAEKLRDQLYLANSTFNKVLNMYTTPAAARSLQKFDRTLFTNKGTFGIVGREALPRDLLFSTMERDVFQSNSAEALKSFKTLIGAEGKYATDNGKQLFKAAKARYMFNAFLDSFDSATAPQARSVFRDTIDLAPGVKAGTEYAQDVMQRLGTDSIETARGFRIEDVRTGNGVFDVTDIRFSPEDFAQFNINKFMNKLGIGKATEDLGREKMIQMLGKDGAKDFFSFTNYMKSISDIPVSDTSTFLQRRFTLGSFGSVAGGIFLGGSAFVATPFAPAIFLLLARKAGFMLTDPTALRYMNDALLPEEQLKLLKGKSIGEIQKGFFGLKRQFSGRSIVPKITAAGLTKKRDAFARLYNYFADQEQDLPRVDPRTVDPKEIQERLLNLSFKIPQPIYDDKNLPAPVIETMYAGDFTKSSGNTTLDNDMVAYLNRVVEADTETVLEQAGRDKEADDPMITDDLQLQPVGAQMAQAPQVPQTPQTPQNQVTPEQVQTLFPFDTTAAAIAQRRQNRG